MILSQAASNAYKASPSVENSRWYKGILSSQLASATETGGTFDFSVATIMTTLITPGGFLSIVNKMNEPAQAITLPPLDGPSYANMDRTDSLTPEEVRTQMPEFPIA